MSTRFSAVSYEIYSIIVRIGAYVWDFVGEDKSILQYTLKINPRVLQKLGSSSDPDNINPYTPTFYNPMFNTSCEHRLLSRAKRIENSRLFCRSLTNTHFSLCKRFEPSFVRVVCNTFNTAGKCASPSGAIDRQ